MRMKKVIKLFQLFIVLIGLILLTGCNKGYYKITLEPVENINVVEDVNLEQVAKDTKLTFRVTVPEGKEVDQFKVDGEVQDLVNLEYKLTVKGNHKLKVTFKDINVSQETVTVSYVTGIGIDLEPTEVAKGGTVEKPIIDVVTYDLVEWQLNGEKFDFDTAVIQDIELTAVWKKKEIVVTIKIDETRSKEVIYGYGDNVHYNEVLRHITENDTLPTKEGYVFAGLEFESESYGFLTKPMTVNVIWLQSSNVTFDYNDGRVVTMPITNDYFYLASQPLVLGYLGNDYDELLLTTPIREGYVFEGWYADPEFKAPINSDLGYLVMNLSSNYYAKWRKIGVDEKTFKITFETNGGTPISPKTYFAGNKEIFIGDSENIIPDALKDGYDFKGWYFDQELTHKFDVFNIDVHIYFDSDFTLYAKWEESETIEDITLTVHTNTFAGTLTSKVFKGITYYDSFGLDIYGLDIPFFGNYDYEVLDENEKPIADNTIFTKDTTLYLKWHKRPIIKYILNNEVIYMSFENQPYYQVFINDNQEKFEFYLDENFQNNVLNSEIYKVDYTLTEDLNLYIKPIQDKLEPIDVVIHIGDKILKIDKRFDMTTKDFSSYIYSHLNGFVVGGLYPLDNQVYLDSELTVDAFTTEDLTNYIVDNKIHLYLGYSIVKYVKVESFGAIGRGKEYIEIIESSDMYQLKGLLNNLRLEKPGYQIEGYYLDETFNNSIDTLPDNFYNQDFTIYVNWVSLEFTEVILTVDTNNQLPLHKIKIFPEFLNLLNYDGYVIQGIYYDKEYLEKIDLENVDLLDGDTIYVKLVEELK